MNIPLFVQWLEDDVVVVNVLHPNFNLLNRRGAAPLKVFNAKTREKEEPSFFGKILSISKSLSFFSCSPIWKAPLTLPLGIKDDIESTIFWQQFYDLDIKGRTLFLSTLQALNTFELTLLSFMMKIRMFSFYRRRSEIPNTPRYALECKWRMSA